MRQCTVHPKTLKDCSKVGLSGPAVVNAGQSGPGGKGSITFQVTVGLINLTLNDQHTSSTFACASPRRWELRPRPPESLAHILTGSCMP
jgi:hypothetical protein